MLDLTREEHNATLKQVLRKVAWTSQLINKILKSRRKDLTLTDLHGINYEFTALYNEIHALIVREEAED